MGTPQTSPLKIETESPSTGNKEQPIGQRRARSQAARGLQIVHKDPFTVIIEEDNHSSTTRYYEETQGAVSTRKDEVYIQVLIAQLDEARAYALRCKELAEARKDNEGTSTQVPLLQHEKTNCSYKVLRSFPTKEGKVLTEKLLLLFRWLIDLLVKPEGMLQDFLVKIESREYPADFVVLHTK